MRIIPLWLCPLRHPTWCLNTFCIRDCPGFISVLPSRCPLLFIRALSTRIIQYVRVGLTGRCGKRGQEVLGCSSTHICSMQQLPCIKDKKTETQTPRSPCSYGNSITTPLVIVKVLLKELDNKRIHKNPLNIALSPYILNYIIFMFEGSNLETISST